MVANIATGGAAICAFAATVGANLQIVDVGVAADLEGLAGVAHRKVRAGTASVATGPAMTATEAADAVEIGAGVAREQILAGADLLVAGEMGIGNTTPAACLIALLCDADPAKVVGPGAGLPEAQLAGKVRIVEAACRRAAGIFDPVELLAEAGGLELAAMAGFYVEAAARSVPIIADGVISLASLLVADRIQPGTAARCIAGHRSTEPGASVALAHLAASPLLELDLRLGEGTGAVLAIPLVVAAATALATMADLPV
jgi:nicotinate-nucleotide--dimethylbenzimidazole phosphoribosyltransferase